MRQYEQQLQDNNGGSFMAGWEKLLVNSGLKATVIH